MLLRIAVVAILTLPLSAQIHFTFRPAAPELTKPYFERNLKWIGLWQATACSDTPTQFDEGRWLQEAAAQGVTLYDASTVDTLATMAAINSKAKRVARITEGGSMIGAGLIAARIIAASSPWMVGFSLAVPAAHYLGGVFEQKQPDFAKIRTLAPRAVKLPDGGCASALIVGRPQ